MHSVIKESVAHDKDYVELCIISAASMVGCLIEILIVPRIIAMCTQ